MVQLDAATFIGVLLGIAGLFTGSLVIMVKINSKMLSSGMREMKESLETKIKNNTSNFSSRVTNCQDKMHAVVDNLKESRDECEHRCTRSVTELDAKHEGLRDRWETFLEKYTVLDATRGNKVDALFRTVDEMRGILKDLRPAVADKIDSLFKGAKDELRMYIREEVRNVVREETRRERQ